MTFWLIFFILVVLAMAVMVGGLIYFDMKLVKSSHKDADKKEDLLLYKAQLRELAADKQNNLIRPEDATSARLEIERRILRASQKGDQAETAVIEKKTSTSLIIATLMVILFGVSLFYFVIGHPGMADNPYQHFMEKQEPTEESMRAREYVAKIKEKLKEDPTEKIGWMALGHFEQQLGNMPESLKAYEQAYKLAPEDVDVMVAYGESLVFFSKGRVNPAALSLFRKALRTQAHHPAARHYMALADYQAGDIREAYDQWRVIAADSPVGAPWLSDINGWIRRAASDLGIKAEVPSPQFTEAPAAPGISEEQKAQVMAMSDAERSELIRSMIKRLAESQAENPENIEGWIRLAKAYQVTGDKQKALESLEQALQHASGKAKDQIKKQLEILRNME